MVISVTPPYLVVAYMTVWMLMFIAFYAYEYRSERSDEGAAALILSASVMVALFTLAALVLTLAWAAQTYVPVFG